MAFWDTTSGGGAAVAGVGEQTPHRIQLPEAASPIPYNLLIRSTMSVRHTLGLYYTLHINGVVCREADRSAFHFDKKRFSFATPRRIAPCPESLNSVSS